MSWMWDAMWARIGWALGELVIALAVVGVVIVLALLYLVYAVVAARRLHRRQELCPHTNMHFTNTYPGRVCSACGKDMPIPTR